MFVSTILFTLSFDMRLDDFDTFHFFCVVFSVHIEGVIPSKLDNATFGQMNDLNSQAYSA